MSSRTDRAFWYPVFCTGLALLLIFVFLKTATHTSHEQLKTVFIDIIHLGAETTSPPAPQKSPMPQSQAFARRAPTAHSPPVGVKPAKIPTKDDFLNRLNALFKTPRAGNRHARARGAGRHGHAGEHLQRCARR